MPKNDHSNIVESESLKNILQVKHHLAGNCIGEHRNQTVVKLGINDGFYEFMKRLCVELVTRNLPLELPRLSIDIEDIVAEKIKEDNYEERDFGVVIEVGV
ncbi:hypothetical protein V6N11_004650 [Hibiscus sabdariffa]|uniref:Uncharacterized protein n=1 Tax=Hibiscus sabdariffa TaxID=183260 RepID=A0ABR2SGZ8_9ROSI